MRATRSLDEDRIHGLLLHILLGVIRFDFGNGTDIADDGLQLRVLAEVVLREAIEEAAAQEVQDAIIPDVRDGQGVAAHELIADEGFELPEQDVAVAAVCEECLARGLLLGRVLDGESGHNLHAHVLHGVDHLVDLEGQSRIAGIQLLGEEQVLPAPSHLLAEEPRDGLGLRHLHAVRRDDHGHLAPLGRLLDVWPLLEAKRLVDVFDLPEVQEQPDRLRQCRQAENLTVYAIAAAHVGTTGGDKGGAAAG
eukprot:CAMPEP_0183395650 /NCGR_PEP_ID=MMETSP0370-20130417/9475_1 /TAXON_ID=268820 /ORGANISM="Peridinium aciculiferum, Strain PAER-2" /LENGTH=250 /DNA_ID=CAMNT_0025576307 /DNA_START=202 /DNA_END=951 /DNA_ORIENTATION=-